MVQEHKANTVINPLTEGAVAAAQKHPDDALLRAAARVAQTQAAPVKNDKPVGMAANSKKTAGRQVLKAKQWLEHQYRQEYTVEGLCPHCGQKHPRKLIGDISDYLRVVQHNLRELLHEGQFSCPVVACSHCGAVYADRPAAMPVMYSYAAGCQASAELVIEYANMAACGIPLYRSDVICGSDTVTTGNGKLRSPDSNVGHGWHRRHSGRTYQSRCPPG